MSFLGEIKRRKVFQVAAVYAVVSWLLIQIVATVEAPLNLPDWVDTLVILLLIIGFPVTMVMSWAYDLTPEGLVRDRGQKDPSSGRAIEYVFIGVLVVAVGILLIREFRPQDDVSVSTSVQQLDAPEAESQSDVLPNSVAVLPFENLSPDPNDAYFAAGVHEQIINELAKIRDLNVIARTYVLQYAQNPPAIPAIASALRVEMVMEGSVRYAGDTVRVTAQLIDGITGTHVWNEDYDGDRGDIFAIQSEIAERIATALEAELLPEELQRIEQAVTESAEAYELYLQTMAASVLFPGASIEEIAAFHADMDEAIVLDPEFALAYAQKAFQHTRFRRPDLDWVAAERDARRAIELDPELGLGYAGLALVHEQHGREGEARNAFMTALQFSPGDSRILMEFAILNSYAGDHDQAVQLAEEAVQSDPNSAATHHRLARRLTLAGRLNEAGIPRRNAVRLSDNPGFRGELVRLEIARGHDRVALEELLIVEELTTEPSLRNSIQLAYAFSRLGRSQNAEDYLRQFRMRSEDEELDPGTVMTAHLAAGEPDQAFEVLRMHVESGDPAAGLQGDFVDIRSNWWRDPILDEPRFRALREQIVFFSYE